MSITNFIQGVHKVWNVEILERLIVPENIPFIQSPHRDTFVGVIQRVVCELLNWKIG